MKPAAGTQTLRGQLQVIVLQLAWTTLLCCSVAYAEPDVSQADGNLLTEWHGAWQGRLTNLPPRENAPSIDVLLTIGPGENDSDGCLDWRSEYREGNDLKGVKDYRMCRKPDGSLVLDEGGGLELTVALFGNIMFSLFEVRDVFLADRHQVSGDRMVQEIYFTPASGQASDEVTNYPSQGLQLVEYVRLAGSNP